jgi:hypothetical protein
MLKKEPTGWVPTLRILGSCCAETSPMLPPHSSIPAKIKIIIFLISIPSFFIQFGFRGDLLQPCLNLKNMLQHQFIDLLGILPPQAFIYLFVVMNGMAGRYS